jgi:hypothetical protein
MEPLKPALLGRLAATRLTCISMDARDQGED